MLFVVHGLLLICTIIFLKAKGQLKLISKILFTYLFFIIVMIIGSRVGGPDYSSYAEIYSLTSFSCIGFPLFECFSGTTGNEFIYAFLSSIFVSFNLSLVCWFFFVGALSVLIKLAIYRKVSNYFWLSVFIFFSLVFHKEIGQIRNALAGGVILWAVYFAVHKNFKLFIFSVLLASGVQIFSLSAIVLYPLINFNLNKSLLLKFGSVVILTSSFFGGITSILVEYSNIFPPILARKLLGYFDNDQSYETGLLSLIFILLVLFSAGFSKHFSRDKYAYGYAICIFYGVLGYFLFKDVATLGGRFGDMFVLGAMPIFFARIVDFFSSRYKFTPYFIVLIFGTVMFYRVMYKFPAYESFLFPELAF